MDDSLDELDDEPVNRTTIFMSPSNASGHPSVADGLRASTSARIPSVDLNETAELASHNDFDNHREEGGQPSEEANREGALGDDVDSAGPDAPNATTPESTTEKSTQPTEITSIDAMKREIYKSLVAESDRLYQCPVCLCMLDDPVECQACNNVFCSHCADRLHRCALCNQVPNVV